MLMVCMGHALASGTLSTLGDHGQSAQHYTGETGVGKGYKSSGGDSQAGHRKQNPAWCAGTHILLEGKNRMITQSSKPAWSTE